MKFLTSEQELLIINNILYFYCSKNISIIDEIVFESLENINNALCIDLSFFNQVYKRFNITEVPTILIFKDGVELKRITNLSTINKIESIIVND